MMTSNYEEIARENREGYGTRVGDYGPLLLADLYSDRKHFIFELLQNAEDAGATHVDFRLYNTSLEVRHDGREFSRADVIGICGIHASISQHDRSRIGRFGIGFKSVYAYTTLPEIHSGCEHFAIRDFVIPFRVPERPMVNATTLFDFPFNREAVPAHTAFDEIMDGLYDLGPQVLLFLTNIQKITWEVSGGGSGIYRRDEHRDRELRVVDLYTDREVNPLRERWIVFDREVSAGDKAGNVALAFQLMPDQATSPARIIPVAQSRLIVYFPTTKETQMGFLIHGPFRTTPTREDIRDDDPINRDLMHQVAELVPQALAALRDHGLLTISCLQALPLRSDAFPAGSAFRPVYDSVLQAFRKVPLLPTIDGTHTDARSAVLARSTGLRNLLSSIQLRTLLSAPVNKHWLDGDISETRTSDLWRYLRNQLGIAEFDPESFARHLNDQFLRSQPNAWMARFYAFLVDQPALWQNLPASSGRRGILLDRPIIRLADGSQIRPFRDDGRPAAYVGASEAFDLPTVAPEVSQHRESRAFLRSLGLPEPDEISSRLDQILSAYRSGETRNLTIPQNLDHVKTIVQIMNSNIESSRRKDLRRTLRGTAFLIGKNASNPNRIEYKRPAELYLPTDDLMMYFEGFAGAWFSISNYFRYQEFLKELGVADAVRVSRPRQLTSSGNVIVREERGRYERGTRGFNPDCTIPGLNHALANPSRRRSRFIWNMLMIPNAGNIVGTVERATQQSYANAQTVETVSIMGQLVRSLAWLPDSDGLFHRPSEMSLDDLPPDFSRNEAVAASLGMQASSIRAIARELGIAADVLEYAQQHQDQIRSLMAPVPSRRSESDAGIGDNFDFVTELAQRFERVGARTMADEHNSPGPVADPERRLQRTAAELRTAQTNSRPNQQRFRRVSSRVWDARNSVVRETLYQYYGGKCQVCDQQPFPKVDGRPYFEGLYLVSRTRAEWVERVGSMLCLCPICSAKLQHGSVEADDIIGQIRMQRLSHEGGNGQLSLRMILCGHDISIRYVEQHFIDLRAMVSEAVGHSAG